MLDKEQLSHAPYDPQNLETAGMFIVLFASIGKRFQGHSHLVHDVTANSSSLSSNLHSVGHRRN
jgi:hypothetical protein